MREKFTTFDTAHSLADDEEIEFFLADARTTGDEVYIANAHDVTERAKEYLGFRNNSK
jgi:DNA-binding phage protein